MKDAQHLIDVLKNDYTVTIDWDATKHIGLAIKWDYINHKVYTSMPGYLEKAFLQFNHTPPKKKQNSPHPHVTTQYRAKIYYATEDDEDPPLNKEETKYIQVAAGTLLYYGQAVDNTMFPALSAITTKQANPTTNTVEKKKQLLDYCATQEEVVIKYKASKMMFAVHSNVGHGS